MDKRQRPKTSKSYTFAVRINPIPENPEQMEVDAIIQRKRAAGFTDKDILINAIMRYGHIDPVTFEQQSFNSEKLVDMIADRVARLLASGNLNVAPSAADGDEGEDEEELTPMARRLAKRLVERTKRL